MIINNRKNKQKSLQKYIIIIFFIIIIVIFSLGKISKNSNLIKQVSTNNMFVNTQEKSIAFNGEGTKENPYLIEDMEDFRTLILQIKNNSQEEFYKDTFFLQTANIEFSGDTLPGCEYNNYFSGIYDGGGHYIKNILVEDNNDSCGLFGTLTSTAVLKNFGLVGGTVKATTGWTSGTLVRELSQGTKVINCFSTATLDARGTINVDINGAGGLVGYSQGGTIENSYYAGNIIVDSNNKYEYYAINGCSSKNTSHNVPAIIKNCYWLEGINGYSEKKNTATNSSAKTSEELTGSDTISLLNEYIYNSEENLKLWTIDTDVSQYPILTEEEKNVQQNVELSVGIYIDGQVTENSKIKWYQKDNEYYVFLPKTADRQNLQFNLSTTNDAKISAYDNNNKFLCNIENGEATNVFANDKFILNVSETTGSFSYTINVMQSTINSIHINLTGGDESYQNMIADKKHETSDTGTSLLISEDGSVLTPKIKKMKGRGNSSWIGYPKKSFQVKFEESISMLGMPKSKTWLLMATFQDGSLTRNKVFFDLATQLGLEYSVTSEPADVYINNNYMGSYIICSKVEVGENRVDIGKDDYLLELDNYEDDYQIETAINNSKITIKNPDLDEATTEEINRVESDVKSKMDAIEKLIYDENSTIEQLNELIDVRSIAGMYWLQEITENYDALSGSTYMYYKNGKLYMGPAWDLDYTLNVDKLYATYKEYYILNNSALATRENVNWYKELMKKQEFSDIVDEIFLENISNLEAITENITQYATRIKQSAEMNAIVWPYADKTVSGKYWMHITWSEKDFDEAVKNFKSRIEERVAWYKNEYQNLDYDTILYKITDKDGKEITGSMSTKDFEKIYLPKEIADNATIELSVAKGSETKKELENIQLENGTYQGKVYVRNKISSDKALVKKYNSIGYEINMEVDQLLDIEITTFPNKVKYNEGEKFQTDGMIVIAKYASGKSEQITNYEIDKKEELSLDDKNITISYQEKTAIVPITVIRKNETLGDINNDGKINATDAKLALKYYAGKTILDDDQKIRADVNKDEKINATDAKLILKYYTGKINEF